MLSTLLKLENINYFTENEKSRFYTHYKWNILLKIVLMTEYIQMNKILFFFFLEVDTQNILIF